VFLLLDFQSSRVVRASFKSLVSDDQELEIVCLNHSAEAAARLVKLVYFGSIRFGSSIAEIKLQVQYLFENGFGRGSVSRFTPL
jgi:hypothetical protein